MLPIQFSSFVTLSVQYYTSAAGECRWKCLLGATILITQIAPSTSSIKDTGNRTLDTGHVQDLHRRRGRCVDLLSRVFLTTFGRNLLLSRIEAKVDLMECWHLDCTLHNNGFIYHSNKAGNTEPNFFSLSRARAWLLFQFSFWAQAQLRLWTFSRAKPEQSSNLKKILSRAFKAWHKKF